MRGVCCTLPLLVVLAASPAAATGKPQAHLDQQQTVIGGGVRVFPGTFQTVTAGRRGLLTRVDLPFCTRIAGSVVKLTVADLRYHNSSATPALRFTHSYSDCAWYTFTFKRPVYVHAGDVLRLTVSPQSGEAPLWGNYPFRGNPYPRGIGKWRGNTISFGFKTYVQ